MESKDYFWGPVTSTIDWCEENYAVSNYLAEFFNTTTNIAFLLLSVFGIYNTLKNNFSKSFIIAHLGVILVGFGSWCFHMTLQYELQLMDELPMIYVASIMVWHIFQVHPNSRRGIELSLALTAYSAFVTYAYLIIKNPVFHQVCYAVLVFIVVFRSTYLGVTLPDSAVEKHKLIRLLRLAALGFVLAFAVWNVDNVFCPNLRNWRNLVGLPLGALSQLHGWWHIGTSLGVYYFMVFTEWIHQVLNHNKQAFELQWVGPLCYLRPKHPKRL